MYRDRGDGLQTYKFSRYAYLYWGDHSRGIAECDISLQCSIISFLCCKPSRDSMQQLLTNQDETYVCFDLTQTMMHSIASQGLTTILSLALERQTSLNIKEKLASISENELNVDAPDQVGNIPLMRGAE